MTVTPVSISKVHPSVRLSVRLSICQSVHLSSRMSVQPYVRPSVRLSSRMSSRPAVRPAVRPSVHPLFYFCPPLFCPYLLSLSYFDRFQCRSFYLSINLFVCLKLFSTGRETGSNECPLPSGVQKNDSSYGVHHVCLYSTLLQPPISQHQPPYYQLLWCWVIYLTLSPLKAIIIIFFSMLIRNLNYMYHLT